MQNERVLGSGILSGSPSIRHCERADDVEGDDARTQTETPAEAIRRGFLFSSVQCRDQNFAPIETVTVAGAAQPWKNTVGSDCVR